MLSTMTDREKRVFETYQRLTHLSRQRGWSFRSGRRTSQRLLRSVLDVESHLKQARRDSAAFRAVRSQIEAFLLSPFGVFLRRHAHEMAREFPARSRPKAVANTKSYDSSIYGKRGSLAKFSAKPINLATKRALGL